MPDTTFLTSRVAVKLFSIVSLGALVPILGLGLATFTSVSTHLEERAEEQLSLASREVANAMLERVRISAERIELGGDFEPIEQAIPISDLQRNILKRDEFVITHLGRDLVVGLPRNDSQADWYHLDEPFIFWGTPGESTSSSSRLDVYLPDGQAMIDWQDETVLLRRLSQRFQISRIAGENWRGATFTMPQQYGRLQIMVSEPESELLAPLKRFRTTFPLVVAITLVFALLTTVVLVRKVLNPLEQLKEATERLADQDFDARVQISSGDEFEELGESFNQMTSHLGQQFRTLVRINDLGRIALSKFTPEEIIESVLDQIDDALGGNWSSFLLFENEDGSALRYSRLHGRGAEIATRLHYVSSEEREELPEASPLGSDDMIFGSTSDWPWLTPEDSEAETIVIFPIKVDGQLGALIAAGLTEIPVARDRASSAELDLARRVADQVEVALANARLVGGLERLSLGTLLALARAVDTKSPWTRGHSERVARIGQLIGEAMGYDEATLEVLYRGGLLHDIGKIGIPVSILDKEGKLTDSERSLMQSHPDLGVKILEPIPGFEDILPIVAQHHERIDGLGYPKGLRGDEISIFARIFAVADVFDALASDRPYRAGLPLKRVVEILIKDSGSHFDPEVVTAFRSVLPVVRSEVLNTRYTLPLAPPEDLEDCTKCEALLIG